MLLMHVMTTGMLLMAGHLVRWRVVTTGLLLPMIVNGVVPAVRVGISGFCDRSCSARWSAYPPPSIAAEVTSKLRRHLLLIGATRDRDQFVQDRPDCNWP
jgi:hypothetical protein